jgi:hypothetical protein
MTFVQKSLYSKGNNVSFEELKQYLIDLTTLSPPSSRSLLLLYVDASHAAVSAALVHEK